MQKIPERGAGRINILSAAAHEIHRHIERVIHVALVAHAILEGEGQHARARLVGVEPYGATEAQIAVGLTFGEGRVGKQRSRDGLQGQRDAQHFHHAGFVSEVEVHLHGGRAIHHVEAQLANFRHISGHDAVAAFGHARCLCQRPKRRKSKPEKGNAQRIGNFADLGQMPANFLAGLEQCLERRAGQLELPARL